MPRGPPNYLYGLPPSNRNRPSYVRTKKTVRSVTYQKPRRDKASGRYLPRPLPPPPRRRPYQPQPMPYRKRREHEEYNDYDSD